MPAVLRQKACIACADSKRRCDKQLPECQRCLDRGVDCVYPEPKRHRRDPVTPSSQVEEIPYIDGYANANADADALEKSLGFGDWGSIRAVNLDVSLPDILIPYSPAMLENNSMPSASHPWFLRDETWDMQHACHDAACMTFADLEPFVRTVEEMLRCWVHNGHNSFIHRRLYEKSMPRCLQDAFTTLAAYIGRTSTMEETILQIANDRSSALAHDILPIGSSEQGIRDHLAHIQALFIYTFIRLFDGSIRFRASAEKQLPTLQGWVVHMWEAAKRYQGEDDNRQFPWAISEFDREFDREFDSASILLHTCTGS